MLDKKIDVEKVKTFVDSCGPNTKIYIGCDSERMNIAGLWYADYILAIVVHINGRHGCKLFGLIGREKTEC